MAMRYLLDINVLIALMDPDHAFHHRAHTWWGPKGKAWASCPLTQNGVLRIMASTVYSKSTHFSVEGIASRLIAFTQASAHAYWPDDISILDQGRFSHASILSSKHLTDLYLLALAVEKQGCLATFDQRIPLAAVPAANVNHLCVI